MCIWAFSCLSIIFQIAPFLPTFMHHHSCYVHVEYLFVSYTLSIFHIVRQPWVDGQDPLILTRLNACVARIELCLELCLKSHPNFMTFDCLNQLTGPLRGRSSQPCEATRSLHSRAFCASRLRKFKKKSVSRSTKNALKCVKMQKKGRKKKPITRFAHSAKFSEKKCLNRLEML